MAGRPDAFRGQYKHTLDEKGRLSIPSSFRLVLKHRYGSNALVIVPNEGKNLDVYPLREWEVLEEKISALPVLDLDVRNFRYAYISFGLNVALDPHGRIQISREYRARASLSKHVVIVGMTDTFEVWDVHKFEQYLREINNTTSIDELIKRLGDRGV